MSIKDELDDILNDPILKISDKEMSLFDIPEDMKKAQEAKHSKPDYVAQRKACENFSDYQSRFIKVHSDLKTGKRSIVKISKTYNFTAGHFYFVDGQMLLLDKADNLIKLKNGSFDGRTRCIYENGTESDIYLQTLRKNVVGNGYAITDLISDSETPLSSPEFLADSDKTTGYIYILSSLSINQDIANQPDLYKIGFTVNSVEERIANAVNDPTYLMAPVKIVASYKIFNLNSHLFESLIHQVLDSAQLQISIKDNAGKIYHPKEWYVVPFEIIELIINKILDGTITKYLYNPQIKCLEQTIVKKESTFDTSGMKILTLIIKKVYFDEIMSGEKKIEYRELKQTTLNKYTYLDESDGKRYLRRYDALHFYVGYESDRESAIVEVVDTTYNEGTVEYHLGHILEHIAKKN